MNEAADYLWVVFSILPGAFVIDLMFFTVAVWWGHKRMRRR